jgi:hypothetical protein
MNRQYILFIAFTFSTGLAVYGQVDIDPKIQQLKDAWYQKTQELSELGTKLIGRNKLIMTLQNDVKSLAREYTSNYNQQDRDATYETLQVSAKKLFDKLFQAIRDNAYIRGSFLQEILCNKGDYLKNKKDCPGFLDSIKLILLQIAIEVDLTKKLLEDYEDYLQEIAEIEHELALLGQPSLL